MNSNVKMPEKRRSNLFGKKQTTNKVLPMFLDVDILTESQQLSFWTLSTNKQGTGMHLAFKNFNIKSKNTHQWSEI